MLGELAAGRCQASKVLGGKVGKDQVENFGGKFIDAAWRFNYIGPWRVMEDLIDLLLVVMKLMLARILQMVSST
jgi:hypothetical protein